MPLRPCDAMKIRSHPRSFAVPMIPSYGCSAFTCATSHGTPAALAAPLMAPRHFAATSSQSFSYVSFVSLTILGSRANVWNGTDTVMPTTFAPVALASPIPFSIATADSGEPSVGIRIFLYMADSFPGDRHSSTERPVRQSNASIPRAGDDRRESNSFHAHQERRREAPDSHLGQSRPTLRLRFSPAESEGEPDAQLVHDEALTAGPRAVRPARGPYRPVEGGAEEQDEPAATAHALRMVRTIRASS